MQIFYLPDWLMIILYIVLWPLFQASIAMLGNKVNAKYFSPDSIWLRPKKWEQDGFFYEKAFKIRKWKHLLPDGAKAHKNGFKKKNLTSLDPKYLNSFIIETGRAEIFHILQILPFWIFGLFSPFYVVWIMLAYALIVNIPCIIAQRYNRPRLRRIYEWSKKQKENL